MFKFTRRAIGVIASVAALIGVGAVSANTITGPSSSQSPYIVRSTPGVVTKSILTVGDSVGGYRMVGIPDGLGAFDNGDGTFTVLMHHELGNTAGAVRAHGAKGAFVSKWTIRKDDLSVVGGQDLIQQIATWNTASSSYNAPAKGVALSRLCSADLPPISAFYADGVGYNGRLFMDGEENGATGRAFAHLMDGTSYELPRLGKFSWENSLANPATGAKTVVVGTDDSNGGQIYIYVGDKTTSGSAIDRAGLTNGALYGLKVDGVASEDPATGIASGSSFSLANLGNVENVSGTALESLSVANGVTSFQRPEDGAWDPSNPNDFYFVTTASFTGNSRLWRLRFVDAANPAAGGTIDMLLDGSEGQHMMDNLTVTRRGQVMIQEDPGGNDYLATVRRYSIANDTLTEIAKHDPERFLPGAANFLTNDEESSGIIDVSDILGEGWFLLDVQAHYNIGDTELVEGGQLLALHSPPGKK
ncbi:MAG TPA: alkaline phosphatase PhoX [Roseiflexaceae bacterium]|nr:alkaline phosphatase PhoX [Roseiflexaceae bacterium]